jgi:Ni,Fe-hydrogenase III small subunit
MNPNDPLWVKVAKKVRAWARLNSIWAIHFNSGSCNGCDIEILATLTPRYDVERFGIKLEGSPRHADVLIVTGPVTRQARERLLRTYQQMPEPKLLWCRWFGRCGHPRGCVHSGLSTTSRSHCRWHYSADHTFAGRQAAPFSNEKNY